jgi:electron transfer flavoprotein beta subunit
LPEAPAIKGKEENTMQIYVCVKHVPDTAANIKIAGENGYNDSTCKFIANPYDEYAIEAAVQLVEKQGGEVVIVTVGPEAALATMRGAMAMGAHRGILVKVDGQFLDSDITSQALKAAIEKDGAPDLILMGKGAVDTEGFQTPYRLAAAMNLPVINEVLKLTVDGGKAVAEREIGAGSREVLEAPTPCVLGATKGLNEPRYPKFPDIMKAKKKAVQQFTLGDLGIDAAGAKSELLKLEPVPERSGAKILEGSTRDQVVELVRILREEEKVL